MIADMRVEADVPVETGCSAPVPPPPIFPTGCLLTHPPAWRQMHLHARRRQARGLWNPFCHESFYSYQQAAEEAP
jgi:hypothetical protein